VDDGGQSGLRKDDVGGTTSSVGGTFDGDTDVGTGESGSVVGTVTSHGAKVTETLDTLDDFKLVFREHTGESVRVHDHLVEREVLAAWGRTLLENLGGVHVVTETKTTTGLLGNGKLVTGNHLDLDTEGHGVVNGLLGVRTWGVEDGEETDELEAVTLRVLLVTHDVLVGNGKSAETTTGKLLNVMLQLVLHLR